LKNLRKFGGLKNIIRFSIGKFWFLFKVNLSCIEIVFFIL
jgi:hypothetical protein